MAHGLVAICESLTGLFQPFLDNSLISADIRVLLREVDHLSRVLVSISTILQNQSVAVNNGPQAEHWRTVQQSMIDCEETLQSLNQILTSTILRKPKRGVFGRMRRSIKWKTQAGDISLLRHQLATYRQTLVLSLQLIAV
jgi:hypothetical protein